MNALFDTINKEQEEKDKQNAVVAEVTDIPEAVQVLTTRKISGLNGGKGGIHEEIVDTYPVDKANGIIPIAKGHSKAKRMKEIFPDKTYYVVTIFKRIEKVY